MSSNVFGMPQVKENKDNTNNAIGNSDDVLISYGVFKLMKWGGGGGVCVFVCLLFFVLFPISPILLYFSLNELWYTAV